VPGHHLFAASSRIAMHDAFDDGFVDHALGRVERLCRLCSVFGLHGCQNFFDGVFAAGRPVAVVETIALRGANAPFGRFFIGHLKITSPSIKTYARKYENFLQSFYNLQYFALLQSLLQSTKRLQKDLSDPSRSPSGSFFALFFTLHNAGCILTRYNRFARRFYRRYSYRILSQLRSGRKSFGNFIESYIESLLIEGLLIGNLLIGNLLIENLLTE
jgi:hypothetical protein